MSKEPEYSVWFGARLLGAWMPLDAAQALAKETADYYKIPVLELPPEKSMFDVSQDALRVYISSP
jgi:hypothetical protein